MVRRVVGTFVPWLGVSLVVYSCVEQSDAPPGGIAGKGGTSAGGGAGRGQSGHGGDAHAGSGASDAAGAGATGTGSGGTGGSGRGGRAGRAGRGGSAGEPGSSLGGAGQASVVVGRCDSPTAWSSNLVGCEGDYVHRPAAGTCELPPRNGEAGAGGMGVVDRSGSCATDADCGSHSYCIENLADAPQCVYGCRQDADCRSDELCACVEGKRAGAGDRISLGTCVPADCSVDADCGTKSLCVSGLAMICVQGSEWWPDHFHCQSAADECNGSFDCGEGGQSDYPPSPRCNYGYNEQHFICTRTPGC